jgi:MoxR-like ATPase
MEPEQFQETFKRLEAEVRKIIVGHGDVIQKVLIAFFAGGHVLLEGVPGLGKTLLVKSLSHALGLSFKRIQFTPDLMPSDIVGTQVLAETNGRRDFQFKKGPIFAHVVLADEINRATPKTQSAVLEATANRTHSKALSWCWRRKIRSSSKALIRFRKRSWIGFFSNCWLRLRRRRSCRKS